MAIEIAITESLDLGPVLNGPQAIFEIDYDRTTDNSFIRLPHGVKLRLVLNDDLKTYSIAVSMMGDANVTDKTFYIDGKPVRLVKNDDKTYSLSVSGMETYIEEAIMAYSGEMKMVNLPLTVTAGAYSDGDVVGGPLAFEVGSTGFSVDGIIRGLVLSDDANQAKAMKLHFFSEEPSVMADNAPFAPTFADLQKRIGSVTIAADDYEVINSNAQAIYKEIGIDFDVPEGILYAYLVTASTPTFAAASDLVLDLSVFVSKEETE